MRLLHLLQVCIFIVLSTIAKGHVIFASNVDDFRSLTKHFIPELADQLVGLVDKSKKVEQINTEEDDSTYKPSQEYEEKDSFLSRNPSQFNTDSKVNTPSGEQHQRTNLNNYDQEESIGAKPSYMHKQPAQVNTQDYIDEEQKDEAEKDLKQYDETKYAKFKENSAVENQSENESVLGQDETKPDEHFRSVKKKVKTVQVNLDELVEKVKERILIDLKPIANSRGYKIVNSKADEAIKPVGKPLKRESLVTHMMPDKTTKFKGESYKRDPDYLDKTSFEQKNPERGKIKNHTPQKSVEVNEEKQGKIMDDDTLLTKVKLSSGKKVDSYEDYKIPKKDDMFDSEEPIKTTKYVKQQVTQQKEREKTIHNVEPFAADRKKPVKAERTTPEYEDYQEKTTEPEMKARTENIGDSREVPLVTEGRPKTKEFFKTLDEDTGKKKNATKKPKLGTMIPVRERFKMSSPNYYGKLPRIAEKYNFNEPIPVKDMEPENLKPIGNPPASINRKVKL